MTDPAFEAALAEVFRLEGGVSNQPADRGGTTKLGVSLAYLRSLGADHGGDIDLDGDVDAADVLAVTPVKARELYRRDFWRPSGAESVAALSQEIATKLFEQAVVSGPSTAARCLQRALTDCRSPVDVDGIAGAVTVGAVKQLSRTALMGELAQALRRRCAEHFLKILDRDRSQLVFALGWIRRALDLDGG